jgi:DNA-binding response OmpR family regulator
MTSSAAGFAQISTLIVFPAASERRFAAETLSAAGLHVTALASFPEARDWMLSNGVSLLVSDVRLAEYNGLHLLIRGRARSPEMAAIITMDRDDLVLRAETERLKATFAVKPLSGAEFLACVGRTLRRPTSEVTPIRPPFERRQGERRQVHRVFLHEDQRHFDRRRPLFEVESRVQLPAS